MAAAELPSVLIDAPHDSGPGGTLTTIRQFCLTLGDVTVELSSLGASITKVLLPRERKPDEDDIASCYKDDVVLSYASPREQFNDKNRQILLFLYSDYLSIYIKGVYFFSFKLYLLSLRKYLTLFIICFL